MSDVDVAVIGYGPVGMAVAALLGRAGHSVLVLERYAGLYNLPRAATFDDETMRTLALLGISEELLPGLRVQPTYQWRNAAGDLLIEQHYAPNGRSGWAEWYMMYQPALEAALDRVCRSSARVQVRHSSPVVAVSQSPDEVTLTVDGGDTVTAEYVVACDGGNSFTRRALGIGEEDLGFAEPWMVCDFQFRRAVDIPMALQVGDPAGPTSIISIGLGHHRFSFMLDSPGDFTAESEPEKVWKRVGRYLSPDDADLIRVATYTFRSLVADEWRRGRILLAGDAAHQMPPFLGQGMVSGIRDAQNLAFKLDLILRGRVTGESGRGAGESSRVTGESGRATGEKNDARQSERAAGELLDTYQREREPHVRALIEKGIELGRAQTIRDPELAAKRDEALLARRAGPEKLRFPALRDGMLAAESGPGRGELSVQGIVDDGTWRDRFDQVVGGGFQFLVAPEASAELERSGVLHALTRVGVIVAVPENAKESGTHRLLDVDGTYLRWFREWDCSAIAVRPDFYVFGTAQGPAAAVALARELTALL